MVFRKEQNKKKLTFLNGVTRAEDMFIGQGCQNTGIRFRIEIKHDASSVIIPLLHALLYTSSSSLNIVQTSLQ